jgi:pimeloyl-ACP methyl ester carboxylesterase/DNA-binding CsgD family transcriptional regulator
MPHPAQQFRFCTSRDGTRIAYATCGAGPPLLWAAHWVHHLNHDWDSPIWGPWLSLLARRHTVIRYDLRGCGLSDRDEVAFSFDKLLEDLEAVIEAAGLERFAYFGMALGAAMGVTLAARHPERLSHLVAYGAYVRNRLARDIPPDQMERELAELRVIERGWQNESPAYGQFFASLHIPDATAEQTRAYNELLRMTTSPANAVRLMRALWSIDLHEVLPLVRCPTLVLQPRGDSIISFDEGCKAAALIPGARFVPLDTRNFILLEQEPAWTRLVAALENFLPTARAIPARAMSGLLHELTAREHDVLELIAQGLDNSTIGTRLGISERTARNHVSTIFSKLGATRRAEVIVRAREAGFGRSTKD